MLGGSCFNSDDDVMADVELKGSVVCVASPEVARNYRWEADSQRLSAEVQVVSAEALDAMPEEWRMRNFGEREIGEGMVFVRDRVERRYVGAAHAQELISQSKNNAIDHVAALLGAVRVSREMTAVEERHRTVGAGGRLGYKMVNAAGRLSEGERLRLSMRYTREKRFSGVRTEESYREAVDYCEATGLIHDPEIRHMLADRAPGNVNPILSDSYEISLTSECDREMNAAFSLSLLRRVFGLSPEVEAAISSTRLITVRCTIEYGDD